mgnify:CR=1 FL=1
MIIIIIFLFFFPFAQLTNELSSLVWSTETKKAEQLLGMNEETFKDSLNDAFVS